VVFFQDWVEFARSVDEPLVQMLQWGEGLLIFVTDGRRIDSKQVNLARSNTRSRAAEAAKKGVRVRSPPVRKRVIHCPQLHPASFRKQITATHRGHLVDREKLTREFGSWLSGRALAYSNSSTRGCDFGHFVAFLMACGTANNSCSIAM
jgi:hypothetical protein